MGFGFNRLQKGHFQKSALRAVWSEAHVFWKSAVLDDSYEASGTGQWKNTNNAFLCKMSVFAPSEYEPG